MMTPRTPHGPLPPDPLAAARGILAGVVIGIAAWLTIWLMMTG